MAESYQYILETEHVSKKFGSLEVLKDINLKVKKKTSGSSKAVSEVWT